MKKTVFFGAGQIGAMVARLAGTEYAPLCFADNYEPKRGSILAGLPVCSPEEALLLCPDCVFLCVLDAERAGQMESQLRSLGYSGEIIRPDALEIFDPRCAAMRLLAEQINTEHVPGDAAELGVYRGAFAARISAAFPDRALHLFDTFEGFAAADIVAERNESLSKAKAGDFSDTSPELVRSALPHPEKAVFYKGFFPDTFSACRAEHFCFVSVDADLYAPTAAALPLFWERLSPGGVLMIHDVNSTQFTGAKKAVDAFCSLKGILPVPVCDLHGSVIIRKQQNM